MQLYAITAPSPSRPLREQVKDWAAAGVHFIQLRQKELDPVQLRTLACELAAAIVGTHSRLLVNIPEPAFADLALAAGAHGVHLPGKPSTVAVTQVRRLFPGAIVSVPCHTLGEVAIAADARVDAILFSPVFEKSSGPSLPQGLDGLRRACAAANGIPIFALGGVTPTNAGQCILAGAIGVAGIRLFAKNDWRGLPPR